MYLSNIDYFYGPYLTFKCTHTCINSSHSPFDFIWNNSQLYVVFGKQECRGMYIYLRESMYVPVYMCVFIFFSETTGPMKPKCMWNQNRIGEES